MRGSFWRDAPGAPDRQRRAGLAPGNLVRDRQRCPRPPDSPRHHQAALVAELSSSDLPLPHLECANNAEHSRASLRLRKLARTYGLPAVADKRKRMSHRSTLAQLVALQRPGSTMACHPYLDPQRQTCRGLRRRETVTPATNRLQRTAPIASLRVPPLSRVSGWAAGGEPC
jgi:hypothetical protein